MSMGSHRLPMCLTLGRTVQLSVSFWRLFLIQVLILAVLCFLPQFRKTRFSSGMGRRPVLSTFSTVSLKIPDSEVLLKPFEILILKISIVLEYRLPYFLEVSLLAYPETTRRVGNLAQSIFTSVCN